MAEIVWGDGSETHRKTIPLTETLPLYRALRATHVPSVLYVYPHGSHNWPKVQGTLGIEHAAAFLRRYLR